MLLRSSVLLLNGLKSSHGSVFCQLSSKTLRISKLQYAHSKNVHRSSFRSSSRLKKSLFSELKIPIVFTVATGSACLLGNQYLGKLVSPRTRDDRTPLGWWNSQADWFKTYWLICGSCVLVFSSFRLAILLSNQFPSYLNFMNRYFVTKAKSTSAIESCAQLILSAFSHVSPLHLGINMYILHNVAQTMIPEMGKDRFLGGYMFCAVLSGLASMSYQLAMGRLNGSVGASGAILGMLGLVMYKHPEYKFYIIFLPFFAIPAPAIFSGMVAMDLMGVIRGWQFFDHAGHLGGLCSGVFWEMLTKSKEEGRPQEERQVGLVPPSTSRLTDDKQW